MRYAVVGASRGTGSQIVHQLQAQGHQVRAISRTPITAGPLIEPFAADVTNAGSMRAALDADFEAIFFTVDVTGGVGGRGFFGSAKHIREVTYQGCLNTMAAVPRSYPKPKFILLSVMGADRTSVVWTVLNAIKPGLKRNMIERERALAESQIPFVTLRAPTLTDERGGQIPTSVTEAKHVLDAKRKITRADLAQAMITAARGAPVNSTWDVFADVGGSAPAWFEQGSAEAIPALRKPSI